VLAWVSTPRYWEEDLARAFFSARHTRTLDGLGYLTLQRFRLYAEAGEASVATTLQAAHEDVLARDARR
jgi:hypothetical protein